MEFLFDTFQTCNNMVNIYEKHPIYSGVDKWAVLILEFNSNLFSYHCYAVYNVVSLWIVI